MVSAATNPGSIADSRCDVGSLRSPGKTVRLSRPLQLVMSGIIGIARLLAAIEGRAVVGRQREAVLQAARQVRIGNEDAAERDGVGMAGGDRRIAPSRR